MEDSIIIGSQVSLSRNITNYPFPHKLSQSESQTISDKIKIPSNFPIFSPYYIRIF